MDSKYIKFALLKYFRFNRQMYVGTEVHVFGGIADILAIDQIKSKSVEVEIKTSKSDYYREFKDKHIKHGFFHTHYTCPNYFYFAFPHQLAEELKNHVPSNYGIISYMVNNYRVFFTVCYSKYPAPVL